jgi:hypothetical protein
MSTKNENASRGTILEGNVIFALVPSSLTRLVNSKALYASIGTVVSGVHGVIVVVVVSDALLSFPASYVGRLTLALQSQHPPNRMKLVSLPYCIAR